MVHFDVYITNRCDSSLFSYAYLYVHLWDFKNTYLTFIIDNMELLWVKNIYITIKSNQIK